MLVRRRNHLVLECVVAWLGRAASLRRLQRVFVEWARAAWVLPPGLVGSSESDEPLGLVGSSESDESSGSG